MALPITPKPIYPNVPQAPGVPSVLRQVGAVQNNVVLLAADAVGVVGLFQGAQWGLFTQAGAPAFGSQFGGIISVVLNALGSSGQSVGDVEFRLDHRVSTAPQEQGAFLSYNKVSTPFSGRVTYIVSGTAGQRSAFLSQVYALQGSTTLLTLMMPEFSYPSCTIVHHDLRRSAKNGVSMFAVDIWVEEVRITGTAAYSNTATPAGAASTNGGTVQPQAPTPSQTPPAGGLT